MHIILNTYGASLTKEDDMFLLSTREEKKKVPPDSVRSISISKGARISSDAALLALENEVEVMFVDRGGKPAGRLWSGKYGSISTIRRRQVEFCSGLQALEWIREILAAKLDNQVALLVSITPHGTVTVPDWSADTSRILALREKIMKAEGTQVRDVAASFRGWEGSASRAYFEAISRSLPLRYSFAGRSKRPARDMYNCLLNYGYGVLYGKVEGALIRAGLDPYLGVMHRDEYNRPVLVYDVIEKFRVWVDYVVTSLCMQEAITEDFFSIGADGGYWLEAAGKRLLIQAINDYFSELVRIDGMSRSRETHIDLFSRALAQTILDGQ